MGIGTASKLEDFGMDPEVRLSLDPEGTQQIGLDPEDLQGAEQDDAAPEEAQRQSASEGRPYSDIEEPEDSDAKEISPSAKHVRRPGDPENSGQLPRVEDTDGVDAADPLADYFMPEHDERAGLTKAQSDAAIHHTDKTPLETYIAALNDEIAESDDPDADRVTTVTLKMLAEAVRNELDERDSSRDAMLKDLKNMVVDEAFVHYRKGVWEPIPEQKTHREPEAGSQAAQAVSVKEEPAALREPEQAMPPADNPHAMPEKAEKEAGADVAPAEAAASGPRTIELPETREGVPTWAFIVVAVVLAIAVVLVAISVMTGLPISALPSLL